MILAAKYDAVLPKLLTTEKKIGSTALNTGAKTGVGALTESTPHGTPILTSAMVKPR